AGEGIGEHLQVESGRVLPRRGAGHGMELMAQQSHLIQVRNVLFGVDITHKRDVEDVAQVPERLAGPYLTPRVRRTDKRLREEQDLETAREIARAHHLQSTRRTPLFSRDICKK